MPAPPAVITRTKVPESPGTATSRGQWQRGECWPWGSPSPEWGQSLGLCVPQSEGTKPDPAEVTAAIPDKGAGGGTRVPPGQGALAPAQHGVHQEIAQRGASDGPQEDPAVVGHDSQHHHIAQHHLQHVEQRLAHVEPKPPGEGDGKCHQQGLGQLESPPTGSLEWAEVGWGAGTGIRAANSSSGKSCSKISEGGSRSSLRNDLGLNTGGKILGLAPKEGPARARLVGTPQSSRTLLHP